MSTDVKRIAIIMFDGCDLMDMAGPADVFATACRRGNVPYELDYLSPDGGAIATWQGISLDTRPLAEVDPATLDTVIAVGGLINDSNCDLRIVEWLKAHHRHFPRLGSVCTGAFILACAGLLDGKRATTHWEDCSMLQAHFPDVSVTANSIFVRDGSLWTSAGITAGIDMALAMVEEDHGHELAMAVARNLVVFLKRPGGQSQFSTHLQSQAREGPLAGLLAWIVEHPDGDLRAEVLAERANMSLRNFYRAFEEGVGSSPAEWVERVRIDIAKRLLEQTDERVDQIARKAGFITYERMRRSFARRLGVTPLDYRERFAAPIARQRTTIDVAVLQEAYGVGTSAAPTLQ